MSIRFVDHGSLLSIPGTVKGIEKHRRSLQVMEAALEGYSSRVLHLCWLPMTLQMTLYSEDGVRLSNASLKTHHVHMETGLVPERNGSRL